MRTIDGLILGCVESSIGGLLHEHPSFFTRFGFALITSLDSTTDLRDARISRQVATRDPATGTLDGALIIPFGSLLEMTRAFDAFQGFDELWFFDGVPSEPKPEDITILGPVDLNCDGPPPFLREWMNQSACALGLGDGMGLNFVTPDPRIALDLLRLTDVGGGAA